MLKRTMEIEQKREAQLLSPWREQERQKKALRLEKKEYGTKKGTFRLTIREEYARGALGEVRKQRNRQVVKNQGFFYHPLFIFKIKIFSHSRAAVGHVEDRKSWLPESNRPGGPFINISVTHGNLSLSHLIYKMGIST